MPEYKLMHTGPKIDEGISRALPGGALDVAVGGLEAALAGKANLSNKNLLDNALFAAPYVVNQRGQSSYSGTWIYTIDLWQLIGGTLNVSTDGITLAAGTNLMYRIEPTMYTSMAGDIYTISVYDGTAYYSATVVAGTTGQVSIANGMKLQLYADAVNSIYGVYLINGDNNISVTLKAAKFELGSISTLANDTPPSPAEQELNRQVCKRYYWQSDMVFFAKDRYNSNHLLCNVRFPVRMRALPAVTIKSWLGTSGVLSTWVNMLDSNVTANANSIVLSVEGFNAIVTSTMADGVTYAFRVVADANL